MRPFLKLFRKRRTLMIMSILMLSGCVSAAKYRHLKDLYEATVDACAGPYLNDPTLPKHLRDLK